MLNRYALGANQSRRPLAVLAAVLMLVALVSACSSSKPGGGSTPTGRASTPVATGGGSTAASQAVTIEVKNFAFAPQTVTVATGGKVTWKFDDSIAHNVSANDKTFKSADLSGGKTFSFTFNKAGTYDYICTIHPFMKAKVVVS